MDWSTKPDGTYRNKRTGETVQVRGGQVVPSNPSPTPEPESSLGEKALKLGLAGVPGVGPLGAAALTAKSHKELVSTPLAALQGLTLNHADEAVTALEAGKNALFQGKDYEAEKARLGPMNERMFNEATDAQPVAHMVGGMALPGPGQLIKAGGVAGALGRTTLAAGEGALASHGADVPMGVGAVVGGATHGLMGEVAPFILGRVRPQTQPKLPTTPAPPSNAPPPPSPELAKTAISAPRPPTPGPPLEPPPRLKKQHPGAIFEDAAPPLEKTNKGGMPRPVPPKPDVVPGRGPQIEGTAEQYPVPQPDPQPYASSQQETVRQRILEFMLKRALPADAAKLVAGGVMTAGNKIAAAVEAASAIPQKAASLLQAMQEDEDFRAEQRKKLGLD